MQNVFSSLYLNSSVIYDSNVLTYYKWWKNKLIKISPIMRGKIKAQLCHAHCQNRFWFEQKWSLRGAVAGIFIKWLTIVKCLQVGRPETQRKIFRYATFFLFYTCCPMVMIVPFSSRESLDYLHTYTKIFVIYNNIHNIVHYAQFHKTKSAPIQLQLI